MNQTLRLMRGAADANASQRALWEMEIERGEPAGHRHCKAPPSPSSSHALLEGGEKVLLFAHHHEVMDIYKRELKSFSPAFITGRETPAMKERSVERFMTGHTDLCCISLRAASGLNLQRATCVVFGELDWSPAVHSQAEDRAHRMGQTDSILCYYLVSQGGSDQEMQDALGLKVSQFVGLMGDTPQSEADALLGRRKPESTWSGWCSAFWNRPSEFSCRCGAAPPPYPPQNPAGPGRDWSAAAGPPAGRTSPPDFPASLPHPSYRFPARRRGTFSVGTHRVWPVRSRSRFTPGLALSNVWRLSRFFS